MTVAAAQDEIVRILTSLRLDGIRNVALTTIEGRSLGSTLTEPGARFKLGAMSAAAVAIATKTSSELTLGDLDQIQIRSSNGSLFLSAVGSKALLSVVTAADVDTMQLAREMRRIALQLNTMV